MKNFLRKVGKIALVFFILILVGVSVAFGIAYFLKNRELNDIYTQYNQATASLNANDQESKITIDNLQESYKELNSKIVELNKENADLKKQLLQEGFGAIKGTILPFLVSDSTIGQYQLVCAQKVSNSSSMYCVSVSGMDPKYTLSLPEGTYKVTARILAGDAKTIIPGYQATYTEYVKCFVSKGVDACDKEALSKSVEVKVEAGKTVSDVNPTDWVTSKATP